MAEPWTAGPWRVRSPHEVEATNGLSVALVSGDPEDTRLIALAPEMAEFIAWSLGAAPFDAEEEWSAMGRELLARARGETV